MGYSTDIFASEPAKRFICAICHDVLKDACSLNCGHTFCGGCIDSYRSSSSNPSCPNCRVTVTSFNPNYIVREVIDALVVKQCPDCNWTGEVKDVESHGNTCAFRVVTCDIEGCNHTCKRKDMGEHTSNTTVMLKHMELKYVNMLKEMEENYERKFAQQETEMKSYKEAVERRMRALESRKRSAEDMSNNTSDTPDEMVVEGCGISAINGIYRRNGTYNDAPKYVHSARYDGLDLVFTLYRYNYGSTELRWYISIIGEGSRLSDTDFYYAVSEDPLPPRTGWISENREDAPPPTVRAS